jgi:hypothetical protein
MSAVTSVKKPPRSDWAEAARRLRVAGGDRLLDANTATHFDEAEWRW